MMQVGAVSTEIRPETGSVRIYCDYQAEGLTDRLWFEVTEEIARYATTECGDAFFVILTLLAHSRSEDIVFSTSVSPRLAYGVVEVLLPALEVVIPSSRSIRVDFNTRDHDFRPEAVGTALSLGVDSFHAVTSNATGPYAVTHVTLFNNGAFGEGETARALFRRTLTLVRSAAVEMDLPLVAVDSNIADVLPVPFVSTHSLRNLACALLLPRLFRVFHYASGYPLAEFRLGPGVDATRYDLLISKAIGTESFEVMIAGLHATRLQKMVTISSYEPALKFLNVCILSETNSYRDVDNPEVVNCSRCYKCVKTMTALDALGLLELYSGVFDLADYSDNRDHHLGWLLYDAKKLKSAHAREALRQGQDQRSGFVTQAAYGHAIRRGTRNLWKKVRR